MSTAIKNISACTCSLRRVSNLLLAENSNLKKNYEAHSSHQQQTFVIANEIDAIRQQLQIKTDHPTYTKEPSQHKYLLTFSCRKMTLMPLVTAFSLRHVRNSFVRRISYSPDGIASMRSHLPFANETMKKDSPYFSDT